MIAFGAPPLALLVIGSIAAAISIAAIVGLTAGLCMSNPERVAPDDAPYYSPAPAGYPAVRRVRYADVSYGPGPLYYPYPASPYSAYPAYDRFSSAEIDFFP
jgi:hypothetical protein